MHQKWEYCVITGIDTSRGGFYTYYPQLTLFSLEGIRLVQDLGDQSRKNRPTGWENTREVDYVAHIIAELGLDGWEMVGAGTGSSADGTGPQCLYFRRPI
jgi:hypothetical protein